MKIHFVRHAKAEERLEWDAPDPLRPLAPRGLAQSRLLARALAREGISRIVSSPHLRCTQTVEPLACLTGIPIEFDDRLAESESPQKVVDLLQEVGDEPVVLCSHGRLITPLLGELEARGALLESGERFRCQKGSTWVVEGEHGLAHRATYRTPPVCESEAADDFERLAVVDLGSTSFRLVVFEATRAGRLRQTLNERVMLRLGAAIGSDGRIPKAICEQAVETARRLGERAREAGASRVLPVATAALRDADNGAKLSRRIEEALGAKVRVVSGEQEARLLFRAFRRRVLLPRRPALGIDLGGGSLELVVGDAQNIHWEATLPVGVTRLHRELVTSDPMRKRDVRQLRERLLEALEPHRATITRLAPKLCIAAGGSARAFARLHATRRGLELSESKDPLEIRVEEFARLTRRLVRADHDERLTIPGIRKNRADLLPTSGILLTTLAESLGIKSYAVCDWGLREGVVLEALDAS